MIRLPNKTLTKSHNNAINILLVQVKEATDLTSWLKGLYERRNIVTALSEHYFSDLKAASQEDGIPLSTDGRPLVHSVQVRHGKGFLNTGIINHICCFCRQFSIMN